jgi:alpha-tubulin suppressor-like RCC1 family protein
LTTEGRLYGWGLYNVNQLGLGNGAAENILSPRRITPKGKPDDSKNDDNDETYFRAISAGGYHALAISRGNRVYSWGSATMGQTGVDKPNSVKGRTEWSISTPTAIPYFANTNVHSISAGFKHSIVLDTCSTVWGFGSDAFGQLGVEFLGATKEFRTLTPVRLDVFSRYKTTPVGIVSGAFHTFVFTRKD